MRKPVAIVPSATPEQQTTCPSQRRDVGQPLAQVAEQSKLAKIGQGGNPYKYQHRGAEEEQRCPMQAAAEQAGSCKEKHDCQDRQQSWSRPESGRY